MYDIKVFMCHTIRLSYFFLFCFMKQKRKNNSVLWSVSLVAQLNIYSFTQNLLSILFMICSVLYEALQGGSAHPLGPFSVIGRVWFLQGSNCCVVGQGATEAAETATVCISQKWSRFQAVTEYHSHGSLMGRNLKGPTET